MKLATLLLATLALSLVSGCACPPQSESYETPLATLQSWQSQLCHDDVQGEWRCLSAELQRAMGGFQTYVAARRKLIEDDGAATWLLGRADLADYVVSDLTDPDTRSAALALDARGQLFEVAFVQETSARINLDDGRFLFAILDGPLSELVGLQVIDGRVTRQWIDLAQPRIDPTDLEHIRSVQLEHRWKINTIAGLQPQAGITP